MADLNAFGTALHSWLQVVWREQNDIFDEANDQAANGEYWSEGGWQVYDRYNAPGRQPAPNFPAFLGECRSIVSDANARGQGMRLLSQAGANAADDFYHFLPVPRVGGARYRVYLHTLQPILTRALPIVRKVVEFISVREGIDEVKVAGPAMTAARCDTIVVYIRDEMYVPWLIRQLRTGPEAGFTTDPPPPGTKRVHPGISWAEEPPRTEMGDGSNLTELYQTGQHSYGSYLAGCIFLALHWNRHEPGDRSPERFLDYLLGTFEAAKIHPKRPHVFDRPAPAPLLPDPYLKGIPKTAV